MQNKKWRVLIFCCVIIHLTFLIGCSKTNINNRGGDDMKTKDIEIILDHKLSRDDLEAYNPDKLSREEYIKECYNYDQETAQDEAYEDIYDYYLDDKEDKKTAQKYFNKLSKERQEKIKKRIERDRELLKDPRYNL